MEWKPIETAPKDGTKVLCYGRLKAPYTGDRWESLGHGVVSYFYDGAWSSDIGETYDFSHWMPLPEPPSA